MKKTTQFSIASPNPGVNGELFGEGYSDLVWTGCATQASNPLPILRVIWEKKVPIIFRDFSHNIGPFCAIFGCSPCKHLKLWAQPRKRTHVREFLQKMGPMFKGFLVKKQPIIAAHPCMS